MKKRISINIILLLFVAVIAVFPLVTIKDSEFGGADGKAEDVIKEASPKYEPWIDSFWAPPGGETESLLFALQAALGAGVIGLVIGYYKGRRAGRETDALDR